MARAGVAAKKGGLTIGSKEMSKLGKGATPSQGARSMRSAGTRKTGASRTSRSRRSEQEDFENMDVDEINGLVKQCADEIQEAEKGKKQVLKKLRNATQQNIKKEVAPFNECMAFYTARQIMLIEIEAAKTPFYEKMPKDNQFYKHFMNGLQLVNMSKSIADTVQLDKDMFKEAAERIAEDKENADGRLSPGKVRRILYD